MTDYGTVSQQTKGIEPGVGEHKLRPGFVA
jgi:hypothetical protein